MTAIMELAGKTALITGAGSGIGRATSLRLSKEGARVAVVDIDSTWGNETVDMIEAAGGQALFLETDVTKESEIKSSAKQTVEAFGGIDILANNAGIVVIANITETSEEQWDRVLNTNLKGAFLMSKHVIPVFLDRGGGVIVNTASDAGIVGFKHLGAYCASKGGLIQLTRSLALEYGDRNIRVNAVAPTSTLNTRMLEGLFDSVPDPDALHKALAEAHPLKRLGTAEEVAELILFLASDRSMYVTGAVYPIDGGITAACPVAEF